MFLLGGDMERFRPPERMTGITGVYPLASGGAPVPVFGPPLPPPRRRDSPEWCLYRALTQRDVREAVDSHVRNFLLLAWRERELRLGGRFSVEYVRAERADGDESPDSHHDSAPLSPPQDSDAEEAAVVALGLNSQDLSAAVRSTPSDSVIGSRLERTLSVFSPSFSVWGGGSIQAQSTSIVDGRVKLVFTPHSALMFGRSSVGRAAERARRCAGSRAI